jgi:hypothetical protein
MIDIVTFTWDFKVLCAFLKGFCMTHEAVYVTLFEHVPARTLLQYVHVMLMDNFEHVTFRQSISEVFMESTSCY